MLLSLVVIFKPQSDCILSAATGRYVHGLLLDLIAKKDKTLGEELHQEARSKSFTVSPLFGEFRPCQKARNQFNKEQEYWFRVTALQHDIAHLLVDIFTDKKFKHFQIGEQPMHVTGTIMDSGKHEWAGTSSYAEIYDRYIIKQQKITKQIRIYFQTPTTFKVNQHQLVLPNPTTLFYSTLEKWNQHSEIPVHQEDFLSWLDNNCVVSRHHIRTRMLDYGKFQYVGFTGSVEFTDMSKKETVYRALWNMLAEYSFWSGIGAKTTMGMGMARLEN
ncbi:MAG: CRISPR-associated endoribonuclease Cas6 [Candidatus Margulisbacteria bacterium]|nr:CRISPR-associated endoribonuclease Cas6 [Candidatus Margulisiibacteriota bacterium]